MGHTTRLVLCFGLFVLGFSAPATAKRVALVVGNDSYVNLGSQQQLKKARNDARAMAKTLKALGYDVDLGLDLGRFALNLKLQDFANRISPGDTATFFFAGHGVQIGGLNYLLPSDAPKIGDGQKDLLKSESIRVDGIVDTIRNRGARLSLLVLDACRNNPFKNSRGRSIGGGRGLARVDPPEGTLVLFSAGAGQVALDRLSDDDAHPNSVFTRTVLPLLKEKDLELSTLTRRVKRDVRALARTVRHVQTPAVYNEVIGDVFLAGRSIVVEPKAEKPRPPVSGAADAWNAIKDVTSVAVLQAFVNEFPDSIYATFAKARIAELKELNKRKEPQKVQRPQRPKRQKAVGVDPRPAKRDRRGEYTTWSDAVNKNTVGAYRDYLRRFPNGAHAFDVRERLRQLGSKGQNAVVRFGSTPVPSDRRSEYATWSDAVNQNTAAAYRDYLRRFPHGAHAIDVQMRLGLLGMSAITPNPNTKGEYTTWSDAVNTGTVRAYRNYLRRFPDGAHAGDVRQRLRRLGIR